MYVYMYIYTCYLFTKPISFDVCALFFDVLSHLLSLLTSRILTRICSTLHYTVWDYITLYWDITLHCMGYVYVPMSPQEFNERHWILQTWLSNLLLSNHPYWVSLRINVQVYVVYMYEVYLSTSGASIVRMARTCISCVASKLHKVTGLSNNSFAVQYRICDIVFVWECGFTYN